MQIKIQSIHFDADSKLINFIEGKVKKLNQYHGNITSSEVFLKIDKDNSNGNKVAEIKVNVPGKELFASRQCKSFEEAVDLSLEALQTQVKKAKEKAQAK